MVDKIKLRYEPFWKFLLFVIVNFILSISTSAHFLGFWSRTLRIQIVIVVLLTTFFFIVTIFSYRILLTQEIIEVKRVIWISLLLSPLIFLGYFSISPHLPMPLKTIRIINLPSSYGNEMILTKVSISDNNVPLSNFRSKIPWDVIKTHQKVNYLSTNTDNILTYQFESAPKVYYTLKFLTSNIGSNVKVDVAGRMQELDLYSIQETEVKITGTDYSGLTWVVLLLFDFTSIFLVTIELLIVFQKCRCIFSSVERSTNVASKVIFSILWALSTLILVKAIVGYQRSNSIFETFISIGVLLLSEGLILLKQKSIEKNVFGLKIIPLLIIAGLVFGLIQFGLIGWNSRYIHDDYAFQVVFRKGYLPVLLLYYQRLIGRFSELTLAYLVSNMTPYFARVLPILSLTAFWVCLSIVFSQVKDYLSLNMTKIICWSASTIVSIVFLLLIPNFTQSFYWMTGNLTYYTPFVFLILNIICLIAFIKYQSYALGIILLLISIFSTGFTEPLSIALVVLMCLTNFLFRKPLIKRPKLKRSLLVLFTGWMIGTIILLASPGNLARARNYPSTSFDFYQIIARSISLPADFLSQQLIDNAHVVLALIISFLIIGKTISIQMSYSDWMRSFAIISTAFISTFAISGVVGELATRALTSSAFFLVVLCVLIGLFGGQIFRTKQPNFNGIVSMVLLISTLTLSIEAWKMYSHNKNELTDFSQTWDQIHNELETQKLEGVTQAIVNQPTIDRYLLPDLGGIESNGNDLPAYYGFEEIIYKP